MKTETLCALLLLPVILAVAFLATYDKKIDDDVKKEEYANQMRGSWRLGQCWYANRTIQEHLCVNGTTALCQSIQNIFVLQFQGQRWKTNQTHNCPQNSSCVDEWNSQFPLGRVYSCKFNLKDPLGEITINGQVPDVYVRGDHLIFLIPGILFFVVACCMCGYILLRPSETHEQPFAV